MGKENVVDGNIIHKRMKKKKKSLPQAYLKGKQVKQESWLGT